MAEAELALDAPVLLLGRGGGGTRLMSELARSCGVFLGARISASGDSEEWIETIYDLAIRQVALGLPSGPCEPADLDRVRQRAEAVLAGAPVAAARWGWKLPETLLALWPVLHAFPHARVVHLVRHPLAMALRRSHMTSRMDNAVGRAVLPAAYRRIGRDPGRIGQDPVWLHNAASWMLQTEHVLACREAARPAPWLQLSFEALAGDPAAAAQTLAEFVAAPSPGRVSIDAVRACAAVTLDETAEAVWAICGAAAERLGYVYASPHAPPSEPLA